MADHKVDGAHTEYWAAREDKEIIGYLRERIRRYYEQIERFGHAERVRKSYAYNVGATLDETQSVTWRITRTGEAGELLTTWENHYRAIGQSMVNLTTAQRPAVQFTARNSDKQSIARAAIGNGLVDYYLTEEGLEGLLRANCENAVFGTEGFIFVDWDAKTGPTKGRVVPQVDAQGMPVTDPTSGTIVAQEVEMPMGDVRFRLFDTFDVVRDVYLRSWRHRTWVILRTWVNKFDLAARYPEVAEDIRAMGAGDDDSTRVLYEKYREDSDLLPVYEFYHEKTPALPDGRYVKFVRNKWLEGGPLPYDKIPLIREAPAELLGTPFGYSPLLDLLGCQETINGIDTSITTNQLGRGIGNLLTPRGANITWSQFGTSMNSIEYDGESKPEPLAMPATPVEFFQYKKDKIGAMEQISGINSVVRGNPNENVGADASGSKLALLQAQAIQQNSGLEKTHVNAVRDVAMTIIRVFRDFGGSEERLLKMIGKYNSYMVKEFLPGDLHDIENVTVDLGNPVTRQISGRMALADRLVELGLIKKENLRHYIQLVKEGTLDPLIEGQEASMLRIEEENEKLLTGDQSWQHRALITDPHWTEIPKHLEILENPDMRQQGMEEVQQRVLEAVQSHMQLFKSMPPELVLMLGGQEAFAMWQLMQQMAGPPMAGPPPPNGPQPQLGTPNAKAASQDMNNRDGMSPPVQMPRQPVNPATGQRAPAAKGINDAS